MSYAETQRIFVEEDAPERNRDFYLWRYWSANIVAGRISEDGDDNSNDSDSEDAAKLFKEPSKEVIIWNTK